MEKLARKIFQPTSLTNEILEGVCGTGRGNISDFVNECIVAYYLPTNKTLRKEVEYIFTRLLKNEEIYAEELKFILARSVEALKAHPIEDVRPLEQIFIHFTNKSGHVLRYDYIQIVDSLQDEKLHRLNEILKTVDSDYNLGKREFGERSNEIFSHWDELCQYSEIYTALALLIDCENIYYKLDVFRTIELIRWLDTSIQQSSIMAIETPFPTNISLAEKYYGIYYEVNVYHTDNGYYALSGDVRFERMSPEIRQYYTELMDTLSSHDEITQDDLNTIIALEKKGRILFRRLHLEK